MSTFVFVVNDLNRSFSGGVPTTLFYDQLNGVFYSIPGGTTELEFLGSATGSSYADGVVGGVGNDSLTGLGNNDAFHGGEGDDVINGNGGSDRLYGDRGANTIDGGTGFDRATADFSDRNDDVVAVNGAVPGVVYGFTVGGLAYGSMTDVEFTESLIGGAGNDRLGGAYVLNVGVNAALDGGAGVDTAVVDLSADTGASLSGGLSAATIYNQNTGYSLSLTGFERLEFKGNATGTAYADGIHGADLGDILTGMDGNDALHGHGGDDAISGQGGDDRLYGGTGVNTIDGGSGFDVADADFSDQTADVEALNWGVPGVVYGFTAGGAPHGSVTNVELMVSLKGGSGNDRLGGAYTTNGRASTIAGGDGTDTAVVDLSADASGSFSGGLGATVLYNQANGYSVTLSKMEALEFTGNATGTSYSSGVVGGDFNDILTGLDGNDVFTGGKGDDLISGGKGDDTLYGDSGTNTIDGGAGTDVASADFSDQTGDVVALNLAVPGTKYTFTVAGTAHGSVTNVEQMVALTGGSGNDRLGGIYSIALPASAIVGGGGTDTAVVNFSGDAGAIFSGGLAETLLYDQSTGRSLTLNGIEVLEFTGNATGTAYATGVRGGAQGDILTGLGGNDVFTGLGGNDIISGGKGNDALYGGTGSNTIDGGEGTDIADADFSDQTGNVVAVNGGVAGTKYNFTVGGAAHGSVINVEQMTGLYGGKGNDRLGGVYTLNVRHSTIAGGDGTDTAVMDLSADTGASLSGGLGQTIIYNQNTGYALNLSDMERLEFTGNATGYIYGDGITGGALDDILIGMDGSDGFHGGDGNDTISGGKGDDRLYGGTGANTIDGGDGDDIADADFSDQTGNVVALNDGKSGVAHLFTVGGKAHGSVVNVEWMVSLAGGSGNDRLGGVYSTKARTSTIAGGAGTDTAVVDLSGDAGVYSGGLGVTLLYNQLNGFSVNLTGIEVLEFTGNASGSSYADGVAGGSGNDILTGLGGNDAFHGGAGADLITGAAGDDRLYGEGGADVIDGGSGNDVASFSFADRTGDVVAVNLGVTGVTYGFTAGGAAWGSVRDVEMLVGLTGGSGNDRLGGVYNLQATSATIDGQDGTDTAVVDLSSDTGGSFNGGANGSGRIYNQTTGQSLLLPGIEGLEFTGNAQAGSYGDGVNGGSGNDILTGLALDDHFHGGDGNDRLRGNGGNDQLYGEGGIDTAVYAGKFAEYGVTKIGLGAFEVTGPEGTDTLRDIEILSFADGEVEYNPTLGLVQNTLQVTPALVTLAEGHSGTTTFSFTIQRGTDAGTPPITSLKIGWSVAGVAGPGTTPAAATDFAGGVFPSGVLTFGSGETQKTITVAVQGDTAVELNERFAVTLGAPPPATIVSPTAAQGVITNDDSQFAIAALAASKAEGHTGTTSLTFTVTRSGATGSAQSVAYAVTGSGANPATATDFAGGTLPAGVLSFAAGEASKTLTVTVAGDTAVEADEGFTVTLSAPSAGASLGTSTAAGSILNDDALLAVAPLAAVKAEGQSGTTDFTFLVSRSGDTTVAHTAAWSVAGSGANPAAAADFAGGALPSGTVSFASGETSRTVTVTVAGDTAVEADEGFTLTLASPSAGATLGTAAAAGSIRNDDATLSIAPLAADRAEGQGGTTGYTFTVSRSGDTSVAHTAAWSVAGSGANPAAAADFAGGVLPSGTVSFAAGETSRTITVPVAGDTAVEPDEGFTVTLAGASAGATLGTAAAAGTIRNDDSSGSGTLSIARLVASRSEGQAGITEFTFRVTRSGDMSGPAVASWAVTGGGASGTVAATAADFGSGTLPSGTVSFTAGQGSVDLVIEVAGDTTVELNESFTVTLANPIAGVSLGTASAVGVIYNDDTAGTGTLSIARASASKPEGSTGTTPFTFTVTRSGTTTGTASADWVVTRGGVPGLPGIDETDLAGGVLPSGRVVFAAGETAKTITVNVVGDTDNESDEGFAVTLTGPQAGVTLGANIATGLVQNDDGFGTGTLSVARLQAGRAEGQSGSTAFTFLVTRSGDASGSARAAWSVTGGTASGTVPANGADFVGGALPAGIVSFAPGETSRTVTVPVAGDAAVELNESFTVTLAAPQSGVSLGTASAVGVIYNDDTPGTGSLSIARATAPKGEGNSGTSIFTFTVSRSGDASGTASADWAVTGGGVANTLAANGADFAGGVLPSGRVAFGAGQTSQTVSVAVAGDGTIELNDSFTITLAAPQAGVSIGTAAATGVILNDDFPPSGVLSIAPLQARRGEGDGSSTAFTFVVTRGGSIAGPASATWAVSGGDATAGDFAGGVLPSGTVSFAPGEVSQVITVPVAGDTAVELDETFSVTMSGVPSGVTLGTASAPGVIVNDDPAGTGSVSIARASAQKTEGVSGSTAFTFTVTRSGDLTGVAGVDWAVTGGGATGTTAANGADFIGGQLPSGRVAFAPGEATRTVSVAVAGDTAAELNESFTVTLANAQAGVAIGTAAAVGVILNDDFASTAGNQALTGTDSADLFLLGGGLDTVLGKGGTDLFRFQPAAVGPVASNVTMLQDFSRAVGEVIDLSAVDAIAGTVADDAFSFIGTAAFSAAGQLRWEDQGAVRLIQGEVTGDGIADVTVLVTAAGPVDATWFVL